MAGITVKTYDTILKGMCDSFDELISPKSIYRSNTNIIYLMFKAIAKGYEVINNVCVVLSNKFDPANCNEDDLSSIASLVGTSRLSGSASGLQITVMNNSSDTAITLKAGTYTYQFDADTSFSFDVLKDTVVDTSSEKAYIAMSTLVGSYPVTAQTSITVTADVEISSYLTFRCIDNTSLLGSVAETDLEFRNRIIEDTDRQDSLVELQTELKNLPYLFDARVKFNNTYNSYTFDDVVIPPFYLAIFYSGEYKNEIAKIVAEKSIFPTVSTNDSVALEYKNEVFTDGKYAVNIIPFRKTQYTVIVKYSLDNIVAEKETVETTMRTSLLNTLNTQVHSDYVKEATVYNVLTDLNITGVNILSVDLIYNGSAVDYISVPSSRIPEMTAVSFEEV